MTITDSEFLRYQRQVALPEIGELGQAKLRNSSILVVGCGGLGCSAIQHLAASGIGHLVIADDDVVEVSNLPRQILYSNDEIGLAKVDATKKAIAKINSDVRVRAIKKKLLGSRLQLECMQADIVLDCSDNFETRQEINRACHKSKTPLVSGAAIGWEGQLATFTYQDSDPCYHCLYPINESQPNMRCSESGVVGPVVGIIGTHQALVAIRLVTLERDLANRLTLFDGLSMQFHQFAIPKDNACSVCNPTFDAQGK
ncbi:molybdopterin-synthase adenylyltransferase MoeB [Vibrio sp. vnigr-6D03]|uniref:HesA/MoeB/ThiF family protein n=1 Tax=Vibrio sp. vnigr-6D03 TaxID=2058088 RepID=UPI000C34D774|nr:HesA/MoeB/ThiF family protein [Vibrio sp. vnigr-6D03]PKF80255.1 molybdopterin-synthase adenylyltransferase MoeB [Vibrio sp. vnigr-6D03]